MPKQLRVELVGDERSLSRALKSIDSTAGATGGKLLSLGKTAAIVGGAAGIGALALGFKAAIDTSIEHQKAMAQTVAVLKSTGGQAGVTAKSVAGLSDSIEKYSGMDDLAIQKGENLLLTFTNIRNEAGKGNDIFDQTTRIMADMSTALGEDTGAAAIQLGKALNDPIKGVTALQKVGVSFTAGQREQIKAMVESGDTMGAQKAILGELTKEFGGSARAAGETFGGKLSILKARLDDVLQAIGDKILPYLTRFVSWLADKLPGAIDAAGAAISTLVGWLGQLFNSDVVQGWLSVWQGVFSTLGDLFGGDWMSAVEDARKLAGDFADYLGSIGSALGGLLDKIGLGDAGDAIRKFFGTIGDAVQAFARGDWKQGLGLLATAVRDEVVAILELVRGLVPKVLEFVGGLGEKILGAIGLGNLGSTFKAFVDDIVQIFRGLIDVIAGIFTGDWGRVFGGLANIFGGLIAGIGDILKGAVQLLWDLASKLGQAIWLGITAGIGALGDLVDTYVVTPIADGLAGFGSTIAGAATGIGTTIATGIADGVTAAYSLVTDAVTGLGSAIGGLASAAWDAVKGVGTRFATVIASGVTAAVSLVTDAVISFGGVIGGLAGRAWEAVVSLGRSLTGRIGSGITAAVSFVIDAVIGLGGTIGGMAGRAWDAVVGLGRSLTGRIAGGISAAVGAIVSAVTDIGGAIGRMAGRAWDEVKALGKALGQKILDGLRFIVDAIKIPGFSVSIPYPSVSLGTGHVSVLGVDIPYPTVDFSIQYYHLSIPGFDPIPSFHAGGLAADEVLAILQRGEFVMSRGAVDNIGVGLLAALNTMHDGGMVDISDTDLAARLRKQHGKWPHPRYLAQWYPVAEQYLDILSGRIPGLHAEDAAMGAVASWFRFGPGKDALGRDWGTTNIANVPGSQLIWATWGELWQDQPGSERVPASAIGEGAPSAGGGDTYLGPGGPGPNLGGAGGGYGWTGDRAGDAVHVHVHVGMLVGSTMEQAGRALEPHVRRAARDAATRRGR